MPQQLLLNEIYPKLQKLVKEYETVKKENEKFKKEIAKMEMANAEKNTELEKIKQQVAILQTTGKQMDEASKKDLEKHINEYIRHIDKAIALLNE